LPFEAPAVERHAGHGHVTASGDSKQWAAEQCAVLKASPAQDGRVATSAAPEPDAVIRDHERSRHFMSACVEFAVGDRPGCQHVAQHLQIHSLLQTALK